MVQPTRKANPVRIGWVLRSLAVGFAVCLSLFLAGPVSAGVIWFQTTSDNGGALFGSSDPARDAAVAMQITFPESYNVCEVLFKLYRATTAQAGVSAVLTIYQPQDTFLPESGTIVSIVKVLESTIPLDPGSGYSQYTTFDLDLAKDDGSGCKLLQKDVLYSFVLTRDVLKAGSSPLIARNRSTDQFAYSNEYKKNGSGAWSSHYPYETIMMVGGDYKGTMAQDFGLLGDLFFPADDSWDRWAGQLDTIQSKVPWGYYYLVKNEIAELSTSTPTDWVISYAPPGYATMTMNITDLYESAPADLRNWGRYGMILYIWIETMIHLIGLAIKKGPTLAL